MNFSTPTETDQIRQAETRPMMQRIAIRSLLLGVAFGAVAGIAAVTVF